ncbi:MAG: hypothetical protein SGI88_02470 [Candidatus Hydrogenedentes bacterium]|nr:hypothetical protein [Candidatus Hydrogenedentota bacterium]
MNVCACPHCGAPRILLSRIPKDVVVVLTCPNCTELVVVFRHRAAGLSRRVIEQGSVSEKKDHIAEIITEFLDPSMFNFGPGGLGGDDDSDDGEEITALTVSDAPVTGPISANEIEQFVRVDLNRIDESRYFREHFG